MRPRIRLARKIRGDIWFRVSCDPEFQYQALVATWEQVVECQKRVERCRRDGGRMWRRGCQAVDEAGRWHPGDWTARVNAPLSARELGRLRVSLERGRPYGDDRWVKRTASELGLEHTVRSEGRPPKRNQAGTRSKN